MINGGTIPNAIADHVQARGTIRAMDAETDQILKTASGDIIAQSELRGFKTTMVHAGYPAVENHPQACERLQQAASEVLSSDGINAKGQPMTGSEDFSYMINATPSRMGPCSSSAAAIRPRGSATTCTRTLLPGRRLPTGGSPDLRQSGDQGRLTGQGICHYQHHVNPLLPG